MNQKIPSGNWSLTLPLAGLGLGYLFLFFLPSQRGLDLLHRDLSDQLNVVAQADTLFPAIAVTEQQLEKARKYNAHWLDISPSEKELPFLFGKINSIAKAAGATTTRFDPQPTVQYDTIRLVSLTAGYRGTFAQISRLLCDLESLPETIWINQLQITAGPKNGKDVECELSLAVFVDKTDESDQAKGSG